MLLLRWLLWKFCDLRSSLNFLMNNLFWEWSWEFVINDIAIRFAILKNIWFWCPKEFLVYNWYWLNIEKNLQKIPETKVSGINFFCSRPINDMIIVCWTEVHVLLPWDLVSYALSYVGHELRIQQLLRLVCNQHLPQAVHERYHVWLHQPVLCIRHHEHLLKHQIYQQSL